MSILMDNFREKTSKIKKDDGINHTAEFDVMYSAGFLPMDYLNSTKVHVDSVYVENLLASKEEFDDIVNTIEDIRLSGLNSAEDIMIIDSFGTVNPIT